MRLLVCGGRDFSDRGRVYRALDAVNAAGRGVDVIVHGDARGADALARDWAGERKVAQAVFPADWSSHGRAAGPIRNQVMIDVGRPDAVLAFPGGRGTADMVARCRRHGVAVISEQELS